MTYRALLLGNSVFEQDPHNLPALAIDDDVAELTAALTDPAVGMFAPDHVTAVSDGSAHELRLAIDDFFSAATRDDVLLLYYTGHGWRDINDMLYLCAADTRTSRVRATAISAAELNLMIDTSAAPAVVIVLDCCFSGSFKGGDTVALAGRGRYVLSSSLAGQLSMAGTEGGRLSPFTASLTAGLRFAPAVGGHLTVSGLYQHAYDTLTSNSLQIPQRRFDGDGDLRIARRTGVRAAEPVPPPVAPEDTALLAELSQFLGVLDDEQAEAHTAAALSYALLAHGRTVEAERYRQRSGPDLVASPPLTGLAQALLRLVGRLRLIGRVDLQLAWAERAMPLLRRLVRQDPATNEPHLALGLTELTLALISDNRDAEAVGPGQEAVGMARALHQAQPWAHRTLLGLALQRYGTALTRTGRAEEGYPLVTDGLTLLRTEPGQEGETAISAYRLADVLEQMGRHAEARAQYEKALTLLEPLAPADPKAYLHFIALSAAGLAVLGTREEAEWRRAVDAFRAAAEATPGRLLPEFAFSLASLSAAQFETGQVDEGHRNGLECLAIYERLPDERTALTIRAAALASRLLDAGRRKEAVDPARTALTTARPLAAEDPDWLEHLAYTQELSARAVQAPGSNRPAAALWYEAARTYREIPDPSLEIRRGLAHALENCALAWRMAGAYNDAANTHVQALEVFDELRRDGVEEVDLEIVDVLGELLLVRGVKGDRVPVVKEMVAVRRRLAGSGDDGARYALAQALAQLAKELSKTGQTTEALAPQREHEEIIRDLRKRKTAVPGFRNIRK